jgi:hypothetical protein
VLKLQVKDRRGALLNDENEKKKKKIKETKD